MNKSSPDPFFTKTYSCIVMLIVLFIVVLLGLLIPDCAFGASPIQPVSYSWTFPPAPNPPWDIYRDDICHISLRSNEGVYAQVRLYYRQTSGMFVSSYNSNDWVYFPVGQTITVDRKAPYDKPCPCIVCVTQMCSSSWTHTQCGIVIKGNEPIPAGWTPFSQMGFGQACTVTNLIFTSNFEQGLLGWTQYPLSQKEGR